MTELPQASTQTLQVALSDLRSIPTAGPWQPCSSCKGNCRLPTVCRRSTAMQAQLLSSSARRPLTLGLSLSASPARLSARSAARDAHSPVFSRHVKPRLHLQRHRNSNSTNSWFWRRRQPCVQSGVRAALQFGKNSHARAVNARHLQRPQVSRTSTRFSTCRCP